MNELDRETLKEKLLNRSEYSDDGCLIWLGCCGSHGYGQMTYKKKGITTHRTAYEVFKEPIPKGLMVLHHCDNRRCINIDHLFLGTAKDNTDDMVSKGRDDLRNGLKLSDETVINIIKAIDEGYSHSQIADMFNTSTATVSRIRTGQSYWWIDG